MDADRLPLPRPPGSAGEAAAAAFVHRRLRSAGVDAEVETFRAPSSPSWVPLIAGALRLAAAALLVAGLAEASAAAAGVSLVASVWPRRVAVVVHRLPGLGAESRNVIASTPGEPDVVDPPLVVVAHLDAHPTSGAPITRPHALITVLVSAVLLALALVSLDAADDPSGLLALLAIEPAATLAWIAHRELVSTEGLTRDDNASGLATLVRIAELMIDERPRRTVWIVATGAATVGGAGMRRFLRTHRDLARSAWVIELDALGASELVLTAGRRRFPRAATPPPVLRAVVGAAIDTGDLIDVRRVIRPHSDADAATASGVAALTLTGGPNTLGAPDAPDAANTERAARIVDQVARTLL